MFIYVCFVLDTKWTHSQLGALWIHRWEPLAETECTQCSATPARLRQKRSHQRVPVMQS